MYFRSVLLNRSEVKCNPNILFLIVIPFILIQYCRNSCVSIRDRWDSWFILMASFLCGCELFLFRWRCAAGLGVITHNSLHLSTFVKGSHFIEGGISIFSLSEVCIHASVW